ncbi:MAG: NAD-dependent malic enzyme [Acidobacteria bacterium]|nr:NAD-dependent malic enzyme [Acidobacteriota bacterium]
MKTIGLKTTTRVGPLLAFAPLASRATSEIQLTKTRGLDVLNSPSLNMGTAFSNSERVALGLTGLLPPEVSTLAQQVQGAYMQFERLPDALSKNIYLTALHDRNEVLFYNLFSEHLREMIPIVNDVTVGLAMKQYHHECRRPRGVYLSIHQIDQMEAALHNLGLGPNDVDLVLATDAENIMGVGDWGIGGVNPKRVIPVTLDAGTNEASLLNDAMYIGNRHKRIRGKQYDDFIQAYVQTVSHLFPRALLQWEDFEPDNARKILAKYRETACTFNDDLQGTGAITLAAIISAVRVCGTPLRHQRVVIFGAGTAGISVANQLRDAMVCEGLSKADACRRIWCVDRQGLLRSGGTTPLRGYQMPYARAEEETNHWKRDPHDDSISLAEVMTRVVPTILIGASAVPGSFTKAMVREMGGQMERPIIFVLSSPASRAEAIPSDLINWTDGRALIATGSPFAPVTFKGVTYVIAQLSNAILYPGLGLGAIVSKASRISDGMFRAAANAVSSLVAVRMPGASLLPQIDDLRSASATVAVAVAEQAEAEGFAGVAFDDIVEQVQGAMWQPEYQPIEAI